MAAAASMTYTGSGLIPCWAPENVREDSVVLRPGTYQPGTVLGQDATITAANDVQTITISGTPTGGTFVLQFAGIITEQTTALNYNCAASDVQAALNALTQIGAAGVVCGGGPGPGTPITVTFSGAAVAARWMPLLTLYSNNLTGGTSPTVAIAHTTPGRVKGGSWAAYNSGNSDGTQNPKMLLRYLTTVDTFGNHTVSGDFNVQTQRSSPAYWRGTFKTKDLVGIDSTATAALGRIVKGSTSSLTDENTVLALEA